MKKRLMFIFFGIIFILGGTLFDATFIRNYTVFEYIVICTWEFVIFALGLFVGYKICELE